LNYKNTDCVYIFNIKDNLYKFGYSSDITTRLNAHRKNFNFEKIIKIYECESINQAKELETSIKYSLKKNNKLFKYNNSAETFKSDNINKDIINKDIINKCIFLLVIYFAEN
jgi:predicted GIY-YIG superfamily endonuclease